MNIIYAFGKLILWKERWDLKKLIHPPSLDSLGRLSFIGDRKLAEDVGAAKTHPYSPFCMLNEYLKFSNICHKTASKKLFAWTFRKSLCTIFNIFHMLLLHLFHPLSLNSFPSYPFCCFLFWIFLDMISAGQIHTKKCMLFATLNISKIGYRSLTHSALYEPNDSMSSFAFLLCLYKLGEFLLSI